MIQATLTKPKNLANPVNIKTGNSTGTDCMFKWSDATEKYFHAGWKENGSLLLFVFSYTYFFPRISADIK